MLQRTNDQMLTHELMINSHDGQMGGWMYGRTAGRMTDCILVEGCMASEGVFSGQGRCKLWGEGGVPWVTVSPIAME